MVPPPEETTHNSLQHIVIVWVALLGVLIGALAVAILALNATVFSAGGFVNAYLGALQRHDLVEALSTPGVLGAANASSELLTPAALGDVGDVSIVSDDDRGGGIHDVTYSATVGAKKMGSTTVTGTFQLQQEENRFGVFSTWSFVRSPMSVLRITPLNDASFTVNGVDLVSPNGPSIGAAYQVLAPGFFVVGHESGYLTADPVGAAVSNPSSVVPIALDIRASDLFVSAIQKQVDDFLDACTTQKVLFPTGCPFGQELSNRVESTPKWTMSQYPKITIEPGNDLGTWVVPEAQGAAHLVVDVRSLFDGTLSTFDEDVQFAVSWVMTINGDRIDVRQQ
jgi:hypothetical protein